MEADRTELNNLADAKPELTKTMSEEWFEFARNVDRLPEKQLKPAGQGGGGKKKGKKKAKSS